VLPPSFLYVSVFTVPSGANSKRLTAARYWPDLAGTVDQCTVSSWRGGDTVPESNFAILKRESHQTILTPPKKWRQFEELAFRFALLRFEKPKGS
jgi:hypothetical protein